MFKTYDQFFEALELPHHRGTYDDIMDASVRDFKKRDKKNRGRLKDLGYASSKGYENVPEFHLEKYRGVRRPMLLDDNIWIEELGEKNGYDVKAFGVFSREEIDMKKVDEIFQEEAFGTWRSGTFNYKRIVIEDHSKTPANIHQVKDQVYRDGKYVNILKPVSFYYVIIGYEQEKGKREEGEVTLEKIQALPEYDEFLEKTGFVLISTPKQLKNITLFFALPTVYVFGDDDDKFYKRLVMKRGTSIKEEYCSEQYAIFDSGYIRSCPRDGRASQMGSFKTNTIEGWKEALKKLTTKVLEYEKEWKEKGIDIIVSPEERHRKRGQITGRGYGV